MIGSGRFRVTFLAPLGPHEPSADFAFGPFKTSRSQLKSVSTEKNTNSHQSRDFSVNTTARQFKNLQQQENRSVEFLTQRREGAKIVNSLTLLIDFAPSRLCVRLFSRLSAHAVSYKSQIGGFHREVSRRAFAMTQRLTG